VDLVALKKSVENCPCGKEHRFDLKALEVDSGNLSRVGEILVANGFPKRILVVADANSLRVSNGIIENLTKSGFVVEMRVYDDMKEAKMEEVDELRILLRRVDGILSVGSGSCNDICRYSTFLEKKAFAIFATAPSMDGFASDGAPILKNGFKISYQCHQPSVIIADTKILAKAPKELKQAGFGDMMAKFIAMADWRIANIVHGDYICPKVMELVRRALSEIVELAPYVSCEDERAVKAIMEALVLSGLCMQFTNTSRPASGAEHVVSHYWECKKLERGEFADYHGKKVGVSTLMIAKIYHKVAQIESVEPRKENLDWEKIKNAYGPNLSPEMMSLNTPPITEEVDLSVIARRWNDIRKSITEEIPTVEELEKLYDLAGATKLIEDIKVDKQLCDDGLVYHPFMRRRINLTRILPMLGLDILDLYYN
jgi:glycerol-1-phosphate dehydrogenase [NAD(P)+]